MPNRRAVAAAETIASAVVPAFVTLASHPAPAREGGALEGTPEDDMRFSYIKYDKPKT